MRVRKSRLEELVEQKNTRAGVVLKISNKLDTYLSAIQLGITFSSIWLGWYCSPIIEKIINESLNINGFSGLAVFIALGLVVLLYIILGEFVPRTIALDKVEKVSMFVAYPLVVFHYIVYPIVVLCNRISKAILCLIGVNPLPNEDIARSEDELRMIVSASERGGELDQMESRLIDNVFDFADRIAREVMVPRQDMVCLYTDDSLKENLETVFNSKHTRYPVCKEDKDHVLGIVHVRDLMGIDPNDEHFDLCSIMRNLIVVPESMSVGNVLQKMQQRRLQIAIIADEFGGTAGLVTIQDLLEEIVGDLQDEDDSDEPEDIVRLVSGDFELDGSVLLDELTDILGIEFDDAEEDTLGGLIFGLLGRRPEVGDKVTVENYKFEILSVEGFRIVRVLASRIQDNGQNDNE